MSENRDEILEEAARFIEEMSFLDLRGIASKRKRDREDAALRAETIKETRKQLAADIRHLKASNRGDAVAVLREISEIGNGWHEPHLRDAWPLAWKGWVDIRLTVKLNSNSIPPETEYRISLTERGYEVLASCDENATRQDPKGLGSEGLPARPA